MYLPGFFALPPVDRDEARFAQASRQMLESVALPAALRDPALHSGGLVIPRVQGRDRLSKPPLIYWAQALSAGVLTFGRPLLDAIWMYRVPSLLAVIATVLMTWRLGSAMFDSRTGRLGAALLACCPIVAWEARQGRADMLLLALNTATMLALWRIWFSRTTGAPGGSPHHPITPSPHHAGGALAWPFAFWLCLALAILTKGPITPLVASLTAVSLSVLSRSWRWLLAMRPEIGLPILLAVVAPWVIAVGERVGWANYIRIITDESLGRVAASRESHWGPPGYHTLLLPVLFWPGSLLTAAGIALALRQGLVAGGAGDSSGSRVTRAFRRLRNLRAGHAPYFFCLCWIVPAWVVFEIVTTKLPHYTLPMYPAIALLSARAVLAAEARLLPGIGSRGMRLARGTWVVIGAALCVLIPIGLAAVDFHLGERRWWFAGIGVVAAVLASANLLAAQRSLGRAQWARAQLAGLAAFLVIALLAIGIMVPRAAPLWISPRIADLLTEADPQRPRPIAAVGFHEDSLVFLTRGRVARISEAEVGAWFRDHPDGLAIVPPLPGEGRAEQVGGTVSGFNYSKGRVERYAVIRGTP